MPGLHLDYFSEPSNYITSCLPSFLQMERSRAGSMFAPSEEEIYMFSSFSHKLDEGYYMVITHNRVWINRARLSILLVVSSTRENEYFTAPVRA